tara:strand:+ start:588 stop:1826 length:1239 start_codon:yes stop_codon:yes gene_type:complete
MALSEPQKIVANSKARFRVASCGRRWGKSVLSLRELCKFASKPNKQVMYVAPTYRMARDIAWGPLKKKLLELNWVKSINESRLEILLVNGSKILLRGADNPDTLRGSGNSFICIDEVADIKPEAWTDVLRPTLSAEEPPGHALFVGTPKGVGNWFFDLFSMAKTHDDWQSFSYTTLDGGNVPAEEVEAAKNDLDRRTFSAEYLASFLNATNQIYYSFHDDNVKKWEGDANDLKRLFLFTDFNVSPLATLIAVPTATGLHIIDELCLYSSNTDEMVQEVRNRYPHQHITAFPDPAGVQRRTSAGGRTDISILQNAGFLVKYRKKHPAVKDRTNAVNSLLLNSNQERRLFIDPKCRELIKCLTRFSYKENTMIPDTGGKVDYSHFPDALGYGVEFMFPVTKQIETQPRQSYGVY